MLAPRLRSGPETKDYYMPFYRVFRELAAIGLRSFEAYGVENLKKLDDEPAIIVANHQTMAETVLDAVAYTSLTGKPVRSVAKSELFKEKGLIRPVAKFMKNIGSIPVDRSGGASSMRRLRRDIADIRENGESVIGYPEGTTGPLEVDDSTVYAFREGFAATALMLKMPILPWAHEYSRNKRPVVGGDVKIHIGEPIMPEDFPDGKGLVERARRLSLMSQRAVADLIGAKVSDEYLKTKGRQ